MKKMVLLAIMAVLILGGLGIYQFIKYVDERDYLYDPGGWAYNRDIRYASDNRSFSFNVTIIDIENTESLKNLDLTLLVDNSTVCTRSLFDLERMPYSGKINAGYNDSDSDQRFSSGDVISVWGDNSSFVEVIVRSNMGWKNEVLHFNPNEVSGKIVVHDYSGPLPDLTLSDIQLFGVKNVTKVPMFDVNKNNTGSNMLTTIDRGFIISFNITNNGQGDAYDVVLSWSMDGLNGSNVSGNNPLGLNGFVSDVCVKSKNWCVWNGGDTMIQLGYLRAGGTGRVFIEPSDPARVIGMDLSPGSSHKVSVTLDPGNNIPETDEMNNALTSDLTLYYFELPSDVQQPSQNQVGALEDEHENGSGSNIGCAVGIGFILVLPLIIIAYVGKWKILGIMIPLYSRVNGKPVLDHFTRGQIYGMIRQRPGIFYKDIKETLELGNGTLLYHLDVLEREGFIRSETLGFRRVFYPTKVAKENKDLDRKFPLCEDTPVSSTLSPFQITLVELIRTKPHIRENELAKITGASRQKVNYNVERIIGKGVVVAENGNNKEKRLRICDPDTS